MQVLFIATANTMATVPPTLRDRMEVIEVPGYTQEDKLQIAKRHLVSKQLEVRVQPPLTQACLSTSGRDTHVLHLRA